MVYTDSATVEGWLKTTLSGERRVRTKGAADILIKRRLGIFKSLVEELHLSVEVRLVKSGDNKADALTGVWKKGLAKPESVSVATDVETMHAAHHMGVERSWYLAKKVNPEVPKDEVKKAVKKCEECQRIDPEPKIHHGGHLGVEKDWTRLSADVVH